MKETNKKDLLKVIDKLMDVAKDLEGMHIHIQAKEIRKSIGVIDDVIQDSK